MSELKKIAGRINAKAEKMAAHYTECAKKADEEGNEENVRCFHDMERWDCGRLRSVAADLLSRPYYAYGSAQALDTMLRDEIAEELEAMEVVLFGHVLEEQVITEATPGYSPIMKGFGEMKFRIPT